MRGASGNLAAQRQRHLAQLIVEQGGGFVQHAPIGHGGGEHRYQGYQDDQRDQQPCADRGHIFGTK